MRLGLLKKISHFSMYGIAGASIFITFNELVCTFASVNGRSMEPTLNPKDKKRNDIVFINRWKMDFNEIKPGDVVVLTDPKNKDSILIKRIIGIEGDLVRTPRYKYDYVLVPRGHCWVEGDNKLRSLDSNSFGNVSLGLIQGKATHILWPPSRWQKLCNNIPSSRYPITREDYVNQYKNLREADKDSGTRSLAAEIDYVIDDLLEYDDLSLKWY